MKKFSKLKKENSKIKNILLGTLLIIGLYLLLSLAISIVCYSGDDPTGNIGLLSLAALLAAGGLGSFINMKMFSEGGNAPLFSSLITLLCYMLISLIATGKLTLGCLMNMLCFSLISLLFIFLGKKKKSRPHHAKR